MADKTDKIEKKSKKDRPPKTDEKARIADTPDEDPRDTDSNSEEDD